MWHDHLEQSQPALEEVLLEAFPQRTQFVLSPLEPHHLRAYFQVNPKGARMKGARNGLYFDI